jgi:sodium-dependent phosphate cotransporter
LIWVNSLRLYRRIRNPLKFLVFLYIFLVSISMMGGAFKGYAGFLHELVQATSNPFVGLVIGILVTSIVQSSSLTTSIVVTLVGTGQFPIVNAVPIVMGANIGTSITSFIVSIGHITRKDEFQKAFSAATVHDFFNVLMVMILFPIELSTHYLERVAGALHKYLLSGVTGGVTFKSPIKVAAAFPVHVFKEFLASMGIPEFFAGIAMLVVALGLLFFALYFMVRLMRSVIMGRIEKIIDDYVFKNALTALGCGILLTACVQSSSVTCSLAVPLVAAGIITLEKAFPFVLGANIGTTITALLASFAAERSGPAVTIALVHLVFNSTGVLLFLPLRPMRLIPINFAQWFSTVVSRRRYVAFIYIVVVFFVIPITLIFLYG